jgi:hypothetical protein
MRALHPNVLIHGPQPRIAEVVRGVQNAFRPPVLTWPIDRSLLLADGALPGTLIVEEVASLSDQDQQQLLQSLRRNMGAMQVVATTTMPLQGLVDRGDFDAALYYSLNLIYLDVSS